jgi:hypothetical protein
LVAGVRGRRCKDQNPEVYNERNNIGIHKMRMPVHDEMTGDIEKSEKARERLREVLRIQEIPCRVPISWNDEYGAQLACVLRKVLDHSALRKRVAMVVLWHPLTGGQCVFRDTQAVVAYFAESMKHANPLHPYDGQGCQTCQVA